MSHLNEDHVISAIISQNYGYEVTVKRLDGERDLNFLIETNAVETKNKAEQFVLKIFPASEDPSFVEAEIAVQIFLHDVGLPVPCVVPTKDNTCGFAMDFDGQLRLGRLVTFVPGIVLAKCKHVDTEFWNSYGRIVGQVCAALDSFDHPATHREFAWDLSKGEQLIRQNIEMVTDKEMQSMLRIVVDQHSTVMSKLSKPLRQSVVHGDLNDWNVFTTGMDLTNDQQQNVAGIVDFGDMIWSDSINDLAIAIAYAVLDRDDPLSIACRMVATCHREWPLNSDELQVLWHRVQLRLATSATMAAKQLAVAPHNEYLGISQAPIGRTLPRLMKIPAGFAYAAFCQACGMALPKSIENAHVWLKSNASRFQSPIRGLSKQCSVRLDWGVASDLISGDPIDLQLKLESVTDELLKQTPNQFGVGGWGEARLVYQTEQFAVEESQPRTVHMGVDVFAVAGTEIIAPFGGTVHAVENIDLPLDYGGVVITRHETASGIPVFILFGHLDPASIENLTVGKHIDGGDVIGRLGDRDVNGGWLPHLHLQVLANDFGLATSFPGVCQAAWQDLWLAFCPNPAAILGLEQDFVTNRAIATETLVSQRQKSIGRSVRLSYQEPLQIVRGWKQYLFDQSAQKYLDAYNNVPHVGHCHPKVVEAATQQMKRLNTNTRYVSRLQTEFAERLAATMPAGLDVCFFLNSASEANELALRLARVYTGGRDMIVNEHAYHGHTTSLIDISPYKHNGRGGEGPPDWVHAVPVPDTYRGEYKIADPDAGQKFASHISNALKTIESRGGKLAGFIAETCPSVGGQIIPPADYLPNIYKLVRAAGGVCIADEVQTGYGRLGDGFYAFERSNVAPDIVILGKPIGNGHPLAALVTTRAIADAFDNGMEYFSTFGGNHVSCAVGLAVLDVVHSEGLQEHALNTGNLLRELLGAAIGHHPLVGEIRGSGLFWGIELVRDRTTLEPATAEASWIKNHLRRRGVLIGTDGPFDNVLKIRPPMPFDHSDVATLVSELGLVLSAIR